MNNESALTINSLGDLQLALLEDNNSAIKNYIERLDRETSNSIMTAAGGQFCFPTVEIEGVVRTSAAHLAKVFGYKQPFGLQKLLASRGIYGVNVGGFLQNVEIKIAESLSLDPQDRKSVLYDWPAFLVGGMNSTNEEARVVQAYLIRMEKIARVGIVATREGQITVRFPEPAVGIVMTKLCKEAWRGNPLASYVLERHYDVPVRQLMPRTEPGLSETAGTISQFLHFVCEDKVTNRGLLVLQTERGSMISGLTTRFYESFLEVARRHHLTQFFSSLVHLGHVLSREADALELLGWKRSVKKSHGDRIFTYEYSLPQEGADLPVISEN